MNLVGMLSGHGAFEEDFLKEYVSSSIVKDFRFDNRIFFFFFGPMLFEKIIRTTSIASVRELPGKMIC